MIIKKTVLRIQFLSILTGLLTKPALLFLTDDPAQPEQLLMAGTLLVDDEVLSSSRSMLLMSQSDLEECTYPKKTSNICT